MAIPLLALFSAASSIASSGAQASAQQAQSMWDSTQMEGNANLMAFRAREATRQGEKDAQRYALQVRKLQGRQRAVAAAQGIEVSDGSALEVQQDTAGLGALDIVTIRNNAWKEAWGYRVESSNLRATADNIRKTGKSNARTTLITGGLQAATTIMKGYSDMNSN